MGFKAVTYYEVELTMTYFLIALAIYLIIWCLVDSIRLRTACREPATLRVAAHFSVHSFMHRALAFATLCRSLPLGKNAIIVLTIE